MPEKSKEYKKLLAKRDTYIRALTYHEPKVKELTEQTSQVNVLTRLAQIESTYEKYTQVTEEIEISDEFESPDLDPLNEEIVEKYIAMASKLSSLKKDILNSTVLNSTVLNTTAQNRHCDSLNIKFPPLPIPTFNGNYAEWTTFHDNWKVMVDSQANMPDVMKMHFLKTNLSGSALPVISKLLVTEANYKIAWDLLCDRFNNKRAIANTCLSKFINQARIIKPTALSLRTLIDDTKESLQSIETIGINIQTWDSIIVYIIQSKLDPNTLKEWESHLHGSKELPTVDQLTDFLETEFRIHETTSTPLSIMSNDSPSSSSTNTSQVNSSVRDHNKKSKCIVCNGTHWIISCPTFDNWSVERKNKFVEEKQICAICFNKHSDPCRSKYLCQICRGQHNTKLHTNQAVNFSAVELHNGRGNKLLASAIVKVKDRFGASHLLRVFIDQGSEGVVITEKAAQLLSLPRKCESISLTGLDNKSLGKASSSVRIQVQSVINDSFEMILDALVKRTILKSRGKTQKPAGLKHLEGVELADPEFWKANDFDLLFGVDIYAIIIENGLKKGKINEPVAQNSALGWLVFGAFSDEQSLNIHMNTLSLSDSLQRFWENEQVKPKKILTEEHQKCIDYCAKNTVRLPNGRLQVSMPFNMKPNDPNFLGDSRRMALRRFFHLEKKFEKNPSLHKRYNEEIMSYIKNKHMRISESQINEGYYLPHHAVIREDSVTTKLRTVFDASAKTTNGYSLNDRCLNGPTIQPELFDTFVRWRMNKVALKTDIEKMYRQICVPPEDRKYLKIVYRFSKNEPIVTYELNTVTFGVKPSPYMAIEATFFLADAEKNKYPEAAKRIKTDFYVDDGLSGSHSTETAKQLQCDLNSIFNSAHLPLRKWASNDEAALDGIPLEHRAIKSSIELNLHESIKTVGIGWTPTTDTLQFTIDMSKLHEQNRITKRQLLSDASKLYDPCGLLSPITIKSKIMMQEVWKTGIDWDHFVNERIQNEWNTYRNELPIIESIKIDRWFKTNLDSAVCLHGFCDSSERAMAAVVYLVQTSHGVTTSSLICSKTRVAPLEPVTIPRLELNGAVLLTELMDRIATNLNISKDHVYLWTDSAIVIHWLNAHASRWKTYVSHRVKEIQDIYDITHWHHVPTHDNPADIASRGTFPSQLKGNDLWFFGPSWLLLSSSQWPKIIAIVPPDSNFEEKTSIKINMISAPSEPPELELLSQFDNFTKMLRITARCIRFIRNYFHKETLKYSKEVITSDELNRAKRIWVKHIQTLYFANDIESIKSTGVVAEKSSLKTLYPQLNEHNIMILHGRFENAKWAIARRFPMILPAKNHLTTLIIDHAHKTTLHGTIHLTLARVRQEFWVLNGRNRVKSFIHKCLRCYRHNPKPMDQLMAPLPIIKTQPARAFAHCGMDYAGPIEIKRSNLRNAPSVKAYICVFVCMASKAIHLELVGDYTTDKFILALRRMMARRGLCSDIYCDQGTNFEGASNELPRLFLQAKSTVSTHIVNTFVNDGITFHFMPPSAPNWGGQWESFVKLTKHHLYRMTTHFKHTYEEMNTLLAQIEACVNSRPLCALTNDMNDLDPLTAGHLLIGSPLNLVPEPSLLVLEDNTLDRFQSIQKTVQTFWKRFSVEYLHTLHPRKKWYKPQEDLAEGDFVSIIDENMPPGKWLMGRVLEIHPSADGFIRLVTIKTKTSKLQRPIAKLCKFPSAPEDVRNRTQNKL